MDKKKVKVGISHGDINGVGYEMIIRTFADGRMFESCTPIIFGSPKVAAYHRKAINLPNIQLNSISKIEDAQPSKINILNCLDDAIRVELGKKTQIAGEASVIALEKAVDSLVDGKIDALVTAPVCSDNTNIESYKFTGHANYLIEKTQVKDALTLMVGENLKVGVVSGEVPFSEVEGHINEDNIFSKLEVFSKSLSSDFRINNPRIAVLALNPKSGVSGKEEKEVIEPAVKKASDKGVLAFGPYETSEFFGSGEYKKYDGVLAMHYDQGVAPFNAMNYERGVTYVAGLPVLAAIPDVKPNFAHAGQGVSSIDPFRKAVYMACDMKRNIKFDKEASKNPLKPSKVTADRNERG